MQKQPDHHFPTVCLSQRIMALDTTSLFAAHERGRLRAEVSQTDASAAGLFEPPTIADGVKDVGNGVRVISVAGILSHGETDSFVRWWYGMLETDEVATALDDAAADSAVRAVVLDLNSPGGYVTGTPELAEAIARFSAAKPIIAHTSSLACSGAFWIGCSATYFYATGSAMVGSVGVFSTHVDWSAYYAQFGVSIDVFRAGANKAAGIAGTSFTDAQREHLQKKIDALGVQFRAHVTACRPNVDAAILDGRVVYGSAAVDAGLIDAIADLKTAIADAAYLADSAQQRNKR